VINASVVSPASAKPGPDDRAVERAIDRAVSRGAVVVAPAGNDGSVDPNVPAAYPHVLSVAATDESGSLAAFSNRGDSVDVAAPGDALAAPAPRALCDTGYARASGTSFAAPAASGAVARLRAARPGLSPSQVHDLLVATAGPSGSVDLASALTAPAPAADRPEVDDDVYWVAGRKPVTAAKKVVRGTVSSDDPSDVLPARLRRGDRLTASAIGAVTLSLWKPSTRAFDISNERTARRARISRSGVLRATASTGGTWFVAVAARGRGAAYTLTVERRRP
jgi:subtilisin family serine protease